MKKIMLLILISLMCAFIFAGCQSNDNKQVTELDPKNPITLTLWHYYVGENLRAIEKAVDNFNQTVGMEQGIIVSAIAKGSITDLESKVTNSAKGVVNSDPMPDIFSSYSDKAIELDKLGIIVDINEYFNEEEKSLYVKNFLEDGVLNDGRLLVLPIVKSTELLYLNSTTWDEFVYHSKASLDDLATWEGVYEVSRKYYNWVDDKSSIKWDGKGLIGFDSVANYIIISNKQLGNNIIDGYGKKVQLNEDILRKIFEIYYKGYSLGYFDSVGSFRSDDIKSGSLIAYVGASSSAAYFPTWIEETGVEKPIEFTPLPYPIFEKGEQYAIQQGAGMCISKTDDLKQLGASIFLKWFTSTENNIEFAMKTGYLPVQGAIYQSEDFSEALEMLRKGDKAENNIADVYEVVLDQVTQNNTYAAEPFEGSYSVRNVLQSTLIKFSTEGRLIAEDLKVKGASEEVILEALNVDQQFELWIKTIKEELTDLNIMYTE